MKALAMTKWLMDVPMSSQLPSSRTRKKKLSVMTSVAESTSTNSDEGGRLTDRVRMPKMAVHN